MGIGCFDGDGLGLSGHEGKEVVVVEGRADRYEILVQQFDAVEEGDSVRGVLQGNVHEVLSVLAT